MINAPDSAAGLTGPCPYCKTRITAPSAPGAAPTAAAPQPKAPVGVGMAPRPQPPSARTAAPRPQIPLKPPVVSPDAGSAGPRDAPSPISTSYAPHAAIGVMYAPRRNTGPAPEGLNWGAFFLTWIWGIAHNVWISLLCLVPAANFVMSFILLFKGNEWAWENRSFESVEQFRQVQRAWMIWGMIIDAMMIILGLLGFIMLSAALHLGMS